MTCPVSSSTLRAPVAACGPETGRPDHARWWALGVLGLALLVVAVDATVLGLAMPLLSDELKPSPTEMLWIGDVYSFVIAGFLVSMGSLRRRSGAAACGCCVGLADASRPGAGRACRVRAVMIPAGLPAGNRPYALSGRSSWVSPRPPRQRLRRHKPPARRALSASRAREDRPDRA